MEEKKIWAVKDGYLVHRDGSIYKLNWRNAGTMRKVNQSKDKKGYLYFNCNGKYMFAHRFVASCFIPNPDNLPEVNHKDETRDNNCVDNLEWCDHSYNINYGTRNKKAAESRISHPKLSKKVYQFTKDGNFVKEWQSLHEIERVLGFDIGFISCCCNGKRKTAYGCIWRYLV